MKDLIADFDTILATDLNYMLGVWTARARKWGKTEAEKALLEFNARNQVTLWGPDGNINDYAAKQWSGLVSDYHATRWALYWQTMTDAITAETPPDWDAYTAAVIQLGRVWDAGTDVYPTTPVGDAVKIATNLLDKYATHAQDYTCHAGMGLPSAAPVMWTAWTKDSSQLALLCDADPLCMGYSLPDGVLSSNVTTMVPLTGGTVCQK
jgi:alpha-N-acetylglucosaminidase